MGAPVWRQSVFVQGAGLPPVLVGPGRPSSASRSAYSIPAHSQIFLSSAKPTGLGTSPARWSQRAQTRAATRSSTWIRSRGRYPKQAPTENSVGGGTAMSFRPAEQDVAGELETFLDRFPDFGDPSAVDCLDTPNDPACCVVNFPVTDFLCPGPVDDFDEDGIPDCVNPNDPSVLSVNGGPLQLACQNPYSFAEGHRYLVCEQL